MGVFTFVCRSSGGEWSAKQLSGDLEASAATPYELQRRLVQAAAAADSSGGVQSSFSLVTPSSAVFQHLNVAIGAPNSPIFQISRLFDAIRQ
ncbi:60S acidic ribosomal protein P3, partial [Ananas comosus]